MIEAGGLIGKIAEFLGQELSKRKFSRDTDKRGRACEAFTRLYFLVVDLHAITTCILEAAQTARDKSDGAILVFRLRDCLRRIQVLSNDYIETFTLLNEPLQIFAPELAEALGAVTAWKFNLLWQASKACIVESTGAHSQPCKIRYLKPEDRLLEIDWGAYVARVATGEAQIRAEHMEWPESLLFAGNIDAAFSEAELDFATQKDLFEFSLLLERHSEVLGRGKLALRSYIAKAFTIEEVLYERKSIEPSWFG